MSDQSEQQKELPAEFLEALKTQPCVFMFIAPDGGVEVTSNFDMNPVLGCGYLTIAQQQLALNHMRTVGEHRIRAQQSALLTPQNPLLVPR